MSMLTNTFLYFFFFCLGKIHRAVNCVRLFFIQVKELFEESHLCFMARTEFTHGEMEIHADLLAEG